MDQVTDWTVSVDVEVEVNEDELIDVAARLGPPVAGSVSGGHGRLGATMTVTEQSGPAEAAAAGIAILDQALAAQGVTGARHVAVEAMTIEEADRRG